MIYIKGGEGVELPSIQRRIKLKVMKLPRYASRRTTTKAA